MSRGSAGDWAVGRRGFLAAGAGIVGAGALGLAGCSSGSSEGSTAKGGKQTLTVMEWTNPPAISFTKWLNKKFEKAHPGVTVKLQDAPTAKGAYNTLTNTALQGKSVDLIAYSGSTAVWPPSYTGLKPKGAAALISAGQMTDLTDQPFMKHYKESQQQSVIGYKDKLYGVWAASYNWGGSLWYKPDLLAKHNVKLPTTFDEFVSACKTLKSNGVTPIFIAGQSAQTTTWWGMLWEMLMKGHAASEADKVFGQEAKAFWSGSKSWDSPFYHEVAKRYEEVFSGHVEPGAAGVAQLTAPGVWAAKADDYAFLVDGSWDGATIKKANPSLKYGFFVLPATNDAKSNRAIFKPDLAWFVPTWAKHKTLALDWLTMFSEPDNYKRWLQETGSFSMQPGQQATGLPWATWLNAHTADAFIQPHRPWWLPTGAPKAAKKPQLAEMVPFGSTSVEDALSQSAKAYTKAVQAAG